ncbi:DsbA family protein [Sandarakinorhabdus sp. DWP1-3-1]|uniref:DsbA family protein n=1 Tax=Sandarakinorhabdus sp. DWP1-3-1 TaxID=2804627 RepID=UPI003CEC3374
MTAHRLALALLLVGGSGMAIAAPARPSAKSARTAWVDVYAATPEGGFRRGNPAAAVKLIEYGSLTCSHCRDFHGQAKAALTKQIATGRLSYEYRSFILNGPDFAASLIARCSGNARTFFSSLDSFYPDQPQWLQPFSSLPEAEATRIAALPEDKQIAAIAVAGKLDVYAAKLGMSRARFDACVTDKAQMDKLLELRKGGVDRFKVTGTPGFVINGVYQEGTYNWTALEPKLMAALKP